MPNLSQTCMGKQAAFRYYAIIIIFNENMKRKVVFLVDKKEKPASPINEQENEQEVATPAKSSFDTSNLMKFISIFALLVAIYHFFNAKFMFWALDQHKAIHLGSGLILVFLLSTKNKSTPYKIFSYLLAILSAGVAIYTAVNYYAIQGRITPSDADLILGILTVLLVLEGTRRSWGPIIPCIVIIAMAYAAFGNYLPGIFYHGGLSIKRIIPYICTNFTGIYGSLSSSGAMEVFMFVLLGCLLEASGGIDFFMKISKGIGSRFRSGPAQTAVIASGCMGTISGSIAANVVTTGSITIPMMIKTGYSKEFAGAVETCASTGGQLMPPVMGVAAFLIASSTSLPYITICKMALYPALVYFLYLCFSIQVKALKLHLQKGERISETKQAFKENGHLLLFLPVLIYLLSKSTPPATAAFWTCVTLIGLVAIKKLFTCKGDLHRFFVEMKEFLYLGFKDGAIQGTKIGLILACLGIMVEIFVITGFAQKMSFQMIELSGGILPLLLFYVALTCILFGMGMPTTGAYLVVSVLAAPALVTYGIPLAAAHFFVFYYGLMASVTPPVGVGAIVASGISNGNYLRTAIEATKLALPGFALPVFFIYRPEILWIDAGFIGATLAFLSALIACICVAVLLERFYLTNLRIWQAVVLLGILALTIDPGAMTSLIGIAAFAALTFVQYRQYLKEYDQNAPAIPQNTAPIKTKKAK